MHSGDTDLDPASLITTASRQTFISGNAVRLMALKLRDKLQAWTAARFGLSQEAVELRGAVLVERLSGKVLLSLEELSAELAVQGAALKAEARYSAPSTCPQLRERTGERAEAQGRLHAAYCFAAQAVVLEAQPATGRVRVLRVIAASDAGRAVNPAAVEGQIEGGVVMGLGYALSEEFRLERGRIATDSLAKLGLWRCDAVPAITCIIIENPHAEGPFGAKGMSELPVSMAAPAVVSALHDALGIWLTRIPATPRRILEALRASS